MFLLQPQIRSPSMYVATPQYHMLHSVACVHAWQPSLSMSAHLEAIDLQLNCPARGTENTNTRRSSSNPELLISGHVHIVCTIKLLTSRHTMLVLLSQEADTSAL